MPFALILIGVLLFITALNGTYVAFGQQLYKDLFTSNPPFVYWVLALVVVGFIGYIPGAKKPADAFMALIIIAMVLKNGGLFTNIQQALKNPAQPAAAASPLAAVAVNGSSNAAASNSAGSSVFGQAQSALGQVTSTVNSVKSDISSISSIGSSFGSLFG